MNNIYFPTACNMEVQVRVYIKSALKILKHYTIPVEQFILLPVMCPFPQCASLGTATSQALC